MSNTTRTHTAAIFEAVMHAVGLVMLATIAGASLVLMTQGPVGFVLGLITLAWMGGNVSL